VLRGGYGVGYNYLNRLGSADILGTNFPIITRAAVAQRAPDPVLNPLCAGDAYAANCFRTTQLGYPTSGLPNNVTLYVPRDIKTPMIQNWQLSVQQEIFWNMVLDVAYVGNKAKNLVILADYNQARPLRPPNSRCRRRSSPLYRRVDRSRASARSRRCCPKGFPITTPCKLSSNAALRTVCIF
jgi:hypothetical protein